MNSAHGDDLPSEPGRGTNGDVPSASAMDRDLLDRVRRLTEGRTGVGLPGEGAGRDAEDPPPLTGPGRTSYDRPAGPAPRTDPLAGGLPDSPPLLRPGPLGGTETEPPSLPETGPLGGDAESSSLLGTGPLSPPETPSYTDPGAGQLGGTDTDPAALLGAGPLSPPELSPPETAAYGDPGVSPRGGGDSEATSLLGTDPLTGKRDDLHAALTIDRVETFAVALPTRRTLEMAGGTVAVAGKPSLRILVKVSGGGLCGWGEATPIPTWTYETAESIVTTIDRYLAPAVIGRQVWDLDGATAAFDRAINRGFSIGAPLAKSAVDVAMHDLLGRALGLPLGVLWGQRRRERIELAWVVSGQSVAEAVDSVAAGRELGYHAFKVKIGMRDEATDGAVVAAVRDNAPGAALWVDANQAYTVPDALRMAWRFNGLGVTAFEQPLPANDIVGLRRLREASPIPVALDESLRHPSDLANFIRLDAVDIAIAKVQRSGGLTLARRMCGLAEDSGVGLMGSGLTDSDVGLAASLHLFAAYGLDTPVDLNGRQFIESPYAGPGVRVESGIAQVPDGPGLGVEVDETAVRRLAVDVLENRG